MTTIWYMVPETWSATDRIFLSSWAIFCPFTLLTAQKIKISKNWRKKPGDIIIQHKCTKNHNPMYYCSWDMVHDRCNCYFSFWTIFCPFTHQTARQKEIKKKKEKITRRYHLYHLHNCTKNNDRMLHCSWNMWLI